jgi:hypothetical protein
MVYKPEDLAPLLLDLGRNAEEPPARWRADKLP